MKRFLILIIAVALYNSHLSGQENVKRSCRTESTDKAPVTDGIIYDDEWGTGPWEGGFTQFEPYEGKEPSQRTEFRILNDNSFIYVAFKAYDSAPDSIVDRLTRRDNMDGDNVGIIIDSYNDSRTGFGFIISSAGVKTDLIFSNNGQSQDATWDPIWFAAASRFPGGWSAEMKIPLNQIRFKSNSGDTWGFEALRQIYRHREMSFWQPIPRNSSGMIHCFGRLEGVGEFITRKQIDLTPYVVGSYERYPAVKNNPFASGNDLRGNAGIDAKIGITNNLTLDLTVLPDFGQVEADPSEVNLTAYETFFQEKRPFFIEGRNITSFRVGIGDGDLGNDNLFYSRRIGRRPQISPEVSPGEYAYIPRQARIYGAAKITGKTKNGFSIGVIDAVTAEEKAEIDAEGERRFETVEPLTNYFISRFQKDINQGNTIIGGIFTNTLRRFDETEITSINRLANSAGVDFTQYFAKKTWMVTGTAAVSNIQGPKEAISATQLSSVHYYQRPDAGYISYDPERTSLSGHAGNLQLGKVGGNWNFVYFTIWKSPGFETNDLGYTRKADEFGQLIWSAYTINKPFSVFNRLRFNFNEYQFWDFGGNFLSFGGNFSVSAQFKNQWNTYIQYNGSGPSTSNTLLRGGPSVKMPGSNSIGSGVSSDSRKKLQAGVNLNYRKGAEGSSESISSSLNITFRPLNTLSITASPNYSVSANELQYVGKRSFGSDDRYIFGRIDQKVLSLSLRVNYNVTPDLSVQYWGQPFLAAVDYSKFKMVTNPKDGSYSNRFSFYNDDQLLYNNDQNKYFVDENADGSTDYSFSNPDMGNNAFLSNLVVRWEFRPGSSVYLVWSQTRKHSEEYGGFEVWDSVDNLFSSKKPYDVFLIKFSYRFGL
jgi:hypothetical protein